MGLQHSPAMPTLFFDLDGTLLDHTASEREAANTLYEALRPHGRTRAEFRRHWHAAQERHFGRYLTGAITYADQRRERMREVVGPSLSDAQVDELFGMYLQAYESRWRLYPDVSDCLDRLDGLTLGVISNGNPDQQWRKLERLGLAGRFRHVLISEAVGHAKPAPAIFREACARACSAPGTTLHIGDRFDLDAIGACDAGLIGVWLNRTGAPTPSAGPHEIRSLDRLPALLAFLFGG